MGSRKQNSNLYFPLLTIGKLKTACFLLPMVFFLGISAHAQRTVKAFSNLIIGNSGFVFYENLEPDPNYSPYNYFEYHWTLSAATDLNKWFRIGAQRIGVYTNFEKSGPFALYGGFVQWDFVPNLKNRGYIELSYHRGNFCNCNELVPFRKEGLNFVGGAVGFDWAFSRHFHLNMGLRILRGHAGDAGWASFGGFFLGLDIHLFPPKKAKAKRIGKDVKHL